MTGESAARASFIPNTSPQIPPDLELVPISRTIGTDQLVDEMVGKFTHTIQMDWMLPGVAPTGKRVEVPVVAIIRFRDGKQPMSTSTGIRRVYWFNSACLILVRCPLWALSA